ncbi:MaoC family dehydratase [Pontivivens ytuae]|uniref:MaoC family dehydratase n=1 Tax=Pontivivens ytuae TaxID=2789856 RepID=A0A7S9LQT7_9RHOB|nr:MaoC family dehydratase [Pontivivens ytuae]QPH53604.1 MaoC family dehydratase [Pontivivens ytuae]
MTLPHRHTAPLEILRVQVGEEVGLSRWFTVDQSRINVFATITEDDQFIHTDIDRAAGTPFGGPIAHGFLTLSLLSAMAYDAVPVPEGATFGVNCGFDRIRFLAPVPSGAQIRGRFVLEGVEEDGAQITTRHAVTVEIEGQDKPALVALWITRAYLAGAE